jgi:uncharacterized Zn finger protein
MRWDRYGYGGGWPEYVPVAARIARAEKLAAKRAKSAGRKPEPVTIRGTAIATTFWGKSWCRNLECYSDFSNRLPRGRTYARNGSVVDLLVGRGRIDAVVAGSTAYDVVITITALPPRAWKAIKADCASSIGSLVDLLSGSLSDDVMRRLARPGDGMFPAPREVKVKCSCPDGARLCKHLAAVLYAIGNRLDTRPELLFLLRDVDQTELVAAATKESVSRAVRGDTAHALADDHLAAIFGIEIGGPEAPPASRARPRVKKSVGPTPKGKAQPAKAKPAAKGKLTAKPKPTAKPKLTAKLESTAKRKPAKRQPKPQPAKRSARTPRPR